MGILSFSTVVLCPALFWAGYHYYKDRHEPEPFPILLFTYVLGWIGLRFDAYELARSDVFGLFWYSVLVIGVVEETIKFLPFWLVVMRISHFNERIDGVIYASFIGLGFASYENLHYMMLLGSREAFLRGIASPIVHVMFASVWGYFCARAWLSNRPLLPAALLGLLLSCVGHGLYDFFMLWGAVWLRPLAAFLILGIWVWRMHLIRELHRRHWRVHK
jgi:RsiW-degrading membrane proteinase PrsW (M82 family)